MHAPAGQESSCDNLIHSNLISGMNIILIFLVVRVMLFKLGDLTITRTLHLELRPYEVWRKEYRCSFLWGGGEGIPQIFGVSIVMLVVVGEEGMV